MEVGKLDGGQEISHQIFTEVERESGQGGRNEKNERGLKHFRKRIDKTVSE